MLTTHTVQFLIFLDKFRWQTWGYKRKHRMYKSPSFIFCLKKLTRFFSGSWDTACACVLGFHTVLWQYIISISLYKKAPKKTGGKKRKQQQNKESRLFWIWWFTIIIIAGFISNCAHGGYDHVSQVLWQTMLYIEKGGNMAKAFF